MRKLTPKHIKDLEPNQVFVFGSNSNGFHGAGASGYAFRNNSDYNWRGCKFFIRAMNSKPGSYDRVGKWAVYGVARGYQEGRKGKSYAIVTIEKPGKKRSIPLEDIKKQIDELMSFAKNHPELEFLVTAIGTKLAGYKTDEIKELFVKTEYIPENVLLPEEFEFRDEKSNLKPTFKNKTSKSNPETTNCNIYKENCDVYCGRPSNEWKDPLRCRPDEDGYFGNPIVIKKECPQCGDIHINGGDTLPCYEKYLTNRLEKDLIFLNEFRKLRGKKLGCFCKPKPCHTDIMITKIKESD